MGLFQQAEGDSAIIVENGVYKQTDVFTRDGYLYAKSGGGFIRLNVDGSTSKSKCRLDHLDVATLQLGSDPVGRLCMADRVSGAKQLSENHVTKLLGAS